MDRRFGGVGGGRLRCPMHGDPHAAIKWFGAGASHCNNMQGTMRDPVGNDDGR